METLITNGIRISVRSQYQPIYSKPVAQEYVFSYHIIIENTSRFTVQLLRRHWIITNSLGQIREVEGEGVIGEQPVLAPGEIHSYDSWCPLKSSFGFMEGSYLMLNQQTEELFQAIVPRFRLESPEVLN